jgi:hypothetical protein
VCAGRAYCIYSVFNEAAAGMRGCKQTKRNTSAGPNCRLIKMVTCSTFARLSSSKHRAAKEELPPRWPSRVDRGRRGMLFYTKSLVVPWRYSPILGEYKGEGVYCDRQVARLTPPIFSSEVVAIFAVPLLPYSFQVCIWVLSHRARTCAGVFDVS